MTYKTFVSRVVASGWTLKQIRFEVPPTSAIMAFLEEVGPNYEKFVLRYEKANHGKN